MRFRSAVDTWFLVFAIVTPVILVFALLPTFAKATSAIVLVAIAIATISVALPAWLLASTCYIVQDGELRVVSGPFRWRIPLAEIRSVQPARSLRASPALSLNRLEIRFGDHGSLLVSPEDREGFLKAIGFPSA